MRRKNALKVGRNPCDINHLKILVSSSLFLWFLQAWHVADYASSIVCNNVFLQILGKRGHSNFLRILKYALIQRRQKMAQKEDRCLFHSAICHSQKHEHVVRLFMHAFEYRYKIIRTTSFLKNPRKKFEKMFGKKFRKNYREISSP